MGGVLLVLRFLITHRLFLDFGCLLNSLWSVGVVQGSPHVGGAKEVAGSQKKQISMLEQTGK